jgi:cytochrome c oxidase cbb3-type subunit 2
MNPARTRFSSWRNGLAVTAAALIAGTPTTLPAAEAVTPTNRALLGHGRFVYLRHCIPCHGPRGDGAGDMARGLKPPPRDFRTAVFKYRSTASGQLPTDGDLARTIRTGLSGTAMPSFAMLQTSEIEAVVQYLKSFSKGFDDPRRHAQALTVPPKPDWVEANPTPPERIAAGQRLYAVACAPCHGDQGGADGPAAPGLLDARGHAAVPRDLQSGTLRSGERPEDLHQLLLSGVGGTPMPAFADTTTADERWELVAFLRALRRPPAPPGH